MGGRGGEANFAGRRSAFGAGFGGCQGGGGTRAGTGPFARSCPSVPTPTDLTLKTAVAAIQFLTPATRGLALRYGIFVRSDCWDERRLIAHELVHTAQYERLGGIRPFLRQYLTECLTIGYPAGPMEQEAIATASRLDFRDLA